jgi:hypothetical protein
MANTSDSAIHAPTTSTPITKSVAHAGARERRAGLSFSLSPQPGMSARRRDHRVGERAECAF